jgi:hypothetical protein
MRGRLEEHLDHLNIRGRWGEIVWVNPSSKCASCHSNEMHQRIIHTHVNVSSKAYVYDETIYNSCARARFAGCTYLRHIILALNTVWSLLETTRHQKKWIFEYMSTTLSARGEMHFLFSSRLTPQTD